MTTLAELRSQVLLNLGRDDSTALAVIDAAINSAVLVTSLTFNPPEMYAEIDLIIVRDTPSISLGNVPTAIDAVSPANSGYITSDFYDQVALTSRINRTSGSFVSDGFVVGDIIYTTSLLNPGPFVITSVSDLILDVTSSSASEVESEAVIIIGSITFGFNGLFEYDTNYDIMPLLGDFSFLNVLDIIKVYNKTNSRKVNFVPYEQWDIIVPSSASAVAYWTLFGTNLMVKSVPTRNTTLTVGYTFYPTKLIDDNQELEFDHYDAYVVSIATSIAFAAFEESEAANLWNSIAGFVAAPMTMGVKARSIIEGQKVILENTIGQIKGGA